MWRNKNLVFFLFRGLKDALHILDGLVLSYALTNELPRKSFVSQHLILRVDKYNGSVSPVNLHGYLLSSRIIIVASRRPEPCKAGPMQATRYVSSAPDPAQS